MRERRSPAELIRPLLIISVWVILAALGNVLVPQLERVVEQHARAFMPADAPSSTAVRQSALLFGESPGNNINYVVLERSTGLTGDDRRFYGDLVSRLHADSAQVTSVTDLWSDPVTAEAAVSADGRAAVVMIRLVGDLGTAEAGDAVRAVRTDVSTLGPPAGLDVYVTGPGATIGDEFAAIDRQMLMITGATVLLILVLNLLDAWFTLLFLSHGGKEMNPMVQAVLAVPGVEKSLTDGFVSVWNSLSKGADDLFFSVLKGDFDSIGGILSGVADSILHTWTSMLVEMVQRWILGKEAIEGNGINVGVGGGFGGGGALGYLGAAGAGYGIGSGIGGLLRGGEFVHLVTVAQCGKIRSGGTTVRA